MAAFFANFNSRLARSGLYRREIDDACRSKLSSACATTFFLGLLVGCGTGSSAEWSGDCPLEDGSSPAHVVILEISPSERTDEIVDSRLDRMTNHVRQAVDCESTLEIVLLDGGRTHNLVRTSLESELNTERARDLQVVKEAEQVLEEVRRRLNKFVNDSEPANSDPGAAFRTMNDMLQRAPTDAQFEVLILSDGVTNTDDVSLNRPLTMGDVAELEPLVAPRVDLGFRVRVDWSGIGRTADEESPPGEWVDVVVALWLSVCEERAAESCVITSS